MSETQRYRKKPVVVDAVPDVIARLTTQEGLEPLPGAE